MGQISKVTFRAALFAALLIWGWSAGSFFQSLAAMNAPEAVDPRPWLTEIAERDWLPTTDARREGGFWLSYDGRTKSARYVVEILHPDQLAKATERVASFRVDTNAPPECRSRPKDYEGSGYDKGHLAPAADWAQTAELQAATFTISNAVPQAPACNRVAWRMLESHVRNLAASSRLVIVVTGPAYVSDGQTLKIELVGDSQVWKPSHLVKAVVWQTDDRFIEAAAWMVPNVNDEKLDYTQHQITIDAAEAALGVDLFAALPDLIEPSIESTGPPERVAPKK